MNNFDWRLIFVVARNSTPSDQWFVIYFSMQRVSFWIEKNVKSYKLNSAKRRTDNNRRNLPENFINGKHQLRFDTTHAIETISVAIIQCLEFISGERTFTLMPSYRIHSLLLTVLHPLQWHFAWNNLLIWFNEQWTPTISIEQLCGYPNCYD